MNIESETFKVVFNHDEQYSIWPANRPTPLGWQDAGKVGTRYECLSHIAEVWAAMMSESLRHNRDAA